MSNVEVDGDAHVATGDISAAFYRMRLPEPLRQHFRLPYIAARHLGVACIDGVKIHSDELVAPQLTVLPIGWSWSSGRGLRGTSR